MLLSKITATITAAIGATVIAFATIPTFNLVQKGIETTQAVQQINLDGIGKAAEELEGQAQTAAEQIAKGYLDGDTLAAAEARAKQLEELANQLQNQGWFYQEDLGWLRPAQGNECQFLDPKESYTCIQDANTGKIFFLNPEKAV